MQNLKDKLKYVYYDQKKPCGHQIKEIKFKFNNHRFRFLTDVGMFSRFKVDTGTKLLLRNLDLHKEDRFLDMCCGYGVVGIIAAKFCWRVVMSDINERGLEMVKRNLKINNINNNSGSNVKVVCGDLFEKININENFTIIAANPPLRAGIDFMEKLIEGADKHLTENGRIFLVARKKQGAYEILERMNEYFSAEIVEGGGGYRVMRGMKV